MAVTQTLAIYQPTRASWALTGAVYAQMLLALACLHRLLLGDPGTVARTIATAYPLPPEVAARLAAGESLDGMPNPTDGDLSYCVRCCMWRPQHAHHCSTVSNARPRLRTACPTPIGAALALASPEHALARARPPASRPPAIPPPPRPQAARPRAAQTAARAVPAVRERFDHHCGVFGRCIGGSARGCRGNMPAFVGRISDMVGTVCVVVVW